MAESTPTALNTDTNNSNQAPPIPDKFVFPSHLPTPPFIDIDGVPNFRDIGGYLTAASFFSANTPSTTTPTMVRKNLLYRCAHPQLLTDQGVDTLATLGIKHIFDLRSAPEVKKLSATLPATSGTDAPTNPHSTALQPNGLTRHFTPVYQEEDYGPVALATKLSWYTSAQTNGKLPYNYSEGFVNAYRDIATNGAKSAYPKILRQIIKGEPLIFHCTAGKDRTGVIAAVLLRLAGVDDETIAWEYALTEPGLGSWRNLFIERIAKTGLGSAGVSSNGPKSSEILESKPQLTREEAARICGSRAGNIKAFLTLVMDKEFGGAEKYVTTMCGLTNEEVAALRQAIVSPVENADDVVQMKGIKGWTADGGVQDGMGLNTEAGPESERRVMAG